MLEAGTLFFQIVTSGIVVVTLANGEQYSKERFQREPHTIYMVAAEMLRSHAESVRKSQLVGDAEGPAPKQKLIAGELKDRPYTRVTPAWLRWNDETKVYQLIPERTAAHSDDRDR